MIGTQERHEDVRNMHGHHAKRGPPHRRKLRTLEAQQHALAPGEHRAGVAGAARDGLVQRAVVPTAPERVLHDEPPQRCVPLAPCHVELAVEREGGALVGGVSDREDRDERRPEQEHVYGEEGARVEERACEPEEEGQEHDGGGECEEDEHVVVGDVHHVCVRPCFTEEERDVSTKSHFRGQDKVDEPVNHVNTAHTRPVAPYPQRVHTDRKRHHLCAVHRPTRSTPIPALSSSSTIASAWSPTLPRPSAESLRTDADIGNFFVSLSCVGVAGASGRL